MSTQSPPPQPDRTTNPDDDPPGGEQPKPPSRPDPDNDPLRRNRPRFAADVILSPHISEKAYGNAESSAYVFVVNPCANRIEVKDAAEELFGVEVRKVNIVNRPGKRVRLANGRYGQRPGKKLAYVMLKPGSKTIDIFSK